MDDPITEAVNEFVTKESNINSFALLFDDISTDSAKEVVQWVIEANYQENKPDIMNLLICSTGGDLHAAFAIIDVMRGSHIPIRTVGLGEISSAGLMIFLAGKKGERILTPNTSIMSHAWSGGAQGKAHELLAVSKEFSLTSTRMIQHYKKCTGLKEKEIIKHLLPSSDVYLSAEEALKYGICDKIALLK